MNDRDTFRRHIAANFGVVAPHVARDQRMTLARNGFPGSFPPDAAVCAHLARLDGFVG